MCICVCLYVFPTMLYVSYIYPIILYILYPIMLYDIILI